jgi:ABC-type protease/lipase transport system fused ATPase/permease subunit
MIDANATESQVQEPDDAALASLNDELARLLAEDREAMRRLHQERVWRAQLEAVLSIGGNIKNVFTVAFVLLYFSLIFLDGLWAVKGLLGLVLLVCVVFYFLKPVNESAYQKYRMKHKEEEREREKAIGAVRNKISHIHSEKRRRLEEERKRMLEEQKRNTEKEEKRISSY